MTHAELIAFKTLCQEEGRRVLRIWMQTIIPPAITLTLYFLIFGKFLGNHIGDIDGVSYIAFITPGFIMMSTLTNAYSNVATSLFIKKFQRSLDDLITAPIPNYIILVSHIIGGIFRGVLIAILSMIIASFFTNLVFTHYLILIITIALSLSALSSAGFINGLIAKKFNDVALIPTFILTPLTYLGGVFYPISHLSHFWQTLSLFNPIIYMVNLFRYGMLGISNINIGFALLMLVLLNIFLGGLAYWLLNRGIGIKH